MQELIYIMHTCGEDIIYGCIILLKKYIDIDCNSMHTWRVRLQHFSATELVNLCRRNFGDSDEYIMFIGKNILY